MYRQISTLLTLCVLLLAASINSPAQTARIGDANIHLEFDGLMHSRVTARFDGRDIPLGPSTASEFIVVNGGPVQDFSLKTQRLVNISDARGTGRQLVLTGMSGALEKTETVESFKEYPKMLFVKVLYANTGAADVSVDGWTNSSYALNANPQQVSPAFWSLESGSYESRGDWVVPLGVGFHQQNYLGMNASDYGGGTPVIDVWRRDVGLAVGHDELTPKLVSLPLSMPSADQATVAVEYRQKQTLKSGQTLKTFETFVAVHEGDYFSTLRDYRRVMIQKGVRFPDAPADGFEPIWCAWGFGRKFQPKQILAALPVVKGLGFKWVTMDDGWQTAEGDWQPNPEKFPHGDADIKALVDKIHAEGFKAQLWWSPMSVSPHAQLFREHPDWLLLDPHGERRKISWWNSYYLCPAVPGVVRLHQRIAEKIIRDWGFDGLKIDGQFLNAVPPCTSPAHHHKRPEDSVEAVPQFFKAIADAARSSKPGTLIELCPCGTAYSFYSMPYYNMSVASDPTSSWQVRSKGKTLKALMGDSLPYFGDHVELSDGGMDFASTVGVGGVIGTEFRWPPNDKASPPSDTESAKLALTPQKREIWAEWVKIYREKMLPTGQYLGNLYDIGFDKPETHCVKKGQAMFYAFYAPNWNGEVELRGLSSVDYKITDYVNSKTLGVVRGPKAKFKVAFKQALLIEADPER
ncbi:MAG: glycoside hydrolase family 36 protein [Bryobacteraceae bacterium]